MQDNGDAGGNLLASVLAILGMDEKNIKEDQSLEGMGMDSMQVLEIRTRLQRATGHPIPLEEVMPIPHCLADALQHKCLQAAG